MKKMLLGIFLFLVIIAAVSINSMIITDKLSDVQNAIIKSLSLPPSIADNYIKEGFEKWEKEAKYLQLMISESSLAVISDCFYDCFNKPESINLRNKLIYELSQLIKAEKLSIQSLF